LRKAISRSWVRIEGVAQQERLVGGAAALGDEQELVGAVVLSWPSA
jgi:hypothetical protein